MFQERCYDRDTEINNNFFAEDMTNNIDMNVNNNLDTNMIQNVGMSSNFNRPLIEPMQERCVHRTIMHEVPQDCQFMLYTKYGMNLHT